MLEIVDDRVTKVWKYGQEKYGNREEIVKKHLAAWVMAAIARKSAATELPPVELVWDGDVVVGVRANV